MQKRLLLIIAVLAILGIGVIALIVVSSKDTPAQPAGTLEEAQTAMDQGEFQTARGMLEQIIVAEPDNSEAHFLLGLTYFNLQDDEKAKTYLLKSADLDPERAAAVHHNLGALAYQNDDMATAIEEFEAALEIEDTNADTHYQLGATYLKMSLSEETYLSQAQSEFERALALSPDKPEAKVGMAHVYMFQNNLGEAIALLEQVLEDTPELPEASLALANIYATSGQKEAAKEVIQRFLDTDPPQEWAAEAQKLLDRINQPLQP